MNFTVYYRKGGKAVWSWHRVAEVFTRDDAQAKAATLKRMGYHALYANVQLLDAIGLPETYESVDALA